MYFEEDFLLNLTCDKREQVKGDSRLDGPGWLFTVLEKHGGVTDLWRENQEFSSKVLNLRYIWDNPEEMLSKWYMNLEIKGKGHPKI